MNSLPPAQLAAWLNDASREPPVLLDVREPWEHQLGVIPGSLQVPMSALPAQVGELDPARPVVCICHVGARSAQVAMWLARMGFEEVYNLSGGVDAWSQQVDPALPRY
ncbi:MAG TPA: rhodanese-like domain-containing protein [Burkholderiaceae bacterium]|nr:rhodanese-like domain-containing protein [Burkholderiaceae bacterium]